MTMPFTCDALLPLADRYASERFRRVAQHFNPARIDYGTALELIAFVETVGLHWAKRILHWRSRGLRDYATLKDHIGSDAEPYIDHNRSCIDEADGLAVLVALRDMGWRKGPLPEMVKDAVWAAHKRREGQKAIQERLGLSKDQFEAIVWRRRAAGSRSRVVVGPVVG